MSANSMTKQVFSCGEIWMSASSPIQWLRVRVVSTLTSVYPMLSGHMTPRGATGVSCTGLQ